jgi:O-antigen/teichoic acid export membrane protein
MSATVRPSRIVAAASNWFAFAAAIGVAFFLTPHLILSLGDARYDIWCVVEAILAYFTLLDLGVGACLVRTVAREHATGRPEGINRIASCSLAVFLVAAAIGLLVGIPLALAFGPQLGLRTGDPRDATVFMLVMMVNLAVTLPGSVFPSILEGLERFAIKAAIRLTFIVVKAIGYVAVTWNGQSLVPLAVVALGCTLAEHAVMALACWRFLPRLRCSPSLLDRVTFRAVWSFSGHAFLTMLAGRITLQTGAILIGAFLPAGQVTIFATVARLVEYAKTLLRAVTTTLTPGIAAMEACGDWKGLRRLFLTGTRVVLYLVLPINAGIVFLGKPFLTRWVGADIADAGYAAMVVLSITVSLGVAQSMAGRVMYGLGRLQWYSRLALAEAAVNIVLTLALIGPYGITGVAIAVTIPNVLFCIVTIVMACAEIGVDGVRYFAEWNKPILAGLVPIVAWSVIGPVAAAWPAILIAAVAGLIPYGIAVVACERTALARLLPLVPSPITGIRSRFGRRFAHPATVSRS